MYEEERGIGKQCLVDVFTEWIPPSAMDHNRRNVRVQGTENNFAGERGSPEHVRRNCEKIVPADTPIVTSGHNGYF